MRFNKGYIYFILCALLGLAGCGGGVSGKNGNDPFNTDNEQPISQYTLSVSILNEQCEAVTPASFNAGDTICVQAKLVQNDVNVSGEIIRFSADLGTLSTNSKLTNANGIAQVSISSETSNIGAAQLIADFDAISADVNYEFLTTDVAVVRPSSLSVFMLKNGQAVNSFKADEQVQLQAMLRDLNDSPIAGEIIQFITGKGSLNTAEALTNEAGLAQVTLIAESTELGAAVATAQTSINDIILINQLNFEIKNADAGIERLIRVGHFDNDGAFIEGEIGVSITNAQGAAEISAGATIGLSVALIDENEQRVFTQTPVSFTSTCVVSENATIDLQVNTINGIAQATYEDISCAGSTGNVDTVLASVVVNNSTVSLTRPITIQAESIGAIGFVSATPTNIVLQGTGGLNKQTVSTLVFNVTGALGNPLPQQQVTFSLNTATGGLSLSPISGITNSLGQVSTRVTSGSVPTSVRVTAEITTDSGTIIRTQSDLLSINTGLPDQNSITLSADNLNPEAYDINEQKVNLVVRLADTFNNPVPDGTAVNFTAESGSIEGSCTTVAGSCSVTWTSANPKIPNHRVTILATAIGHETLFDSNGNNIYDDGDGIGFIDFTDSGFGSSLYGQTGFVDISEAWRDDNENGIWDNGEIFLDYNTNSNFTDIFDSPDGLFNGPQCTGNRCGLGEASTIHVRRALVLVTSSSAAQIDIVDESDSIVASNYQNASSAAGIDRNSIKSYTLVFADTARQPISSGSSIIVTSSAGQLTGQTNFIMPSTNKNAEFTVDFNLENNVLETTLATVIAEITSPSGLQSSASMIVTLN